MWEEANVLAIFLADIHLSLIPPVWRSAEDDWLHVQARALSEVSNIQEEYECPVICAGDIFDRSKKISDGWNAPPELINFAIKHLPNNMYAIPGQHDLPNHQYGDIHRSAYWTLVKAGKIENIKPERALTLSDGFVLYGFPPGYGIKSNVFEDDSLPSILNLLHIAVVHDYIWIEGRSYPNAPEEKKFGKRIAGVKNNKWFGYDIVIYGDNHKGFSHTIENTQIFNCGTLMRRKSDELTYVPQVGLLLESGKIVPYYLDTREDRHIGIVEDEVRDDLILDMSDFFDDLEKLGKTSLDFADAVKEFLGKHKVSNEAKQILYSAMEK